MEQNSKYTPYDPLGKFLKALRDKANETLAEVSGAVEIDIKTLERFEQGNERPSEDILMLLINHFGMQDDEAVSLWELAGYDKARRQGRPIDHEDMNGKQLPLMMMLSLENRVMYSDGVNVTINPSGMVVNFTQVSADNQTVPVARVGMSHQQALSVLETMQQSMSEWVKAKKQTPKALPAPKKPDNSHRRNTDKS